MNENEEYEHTSRLDRGPYPPAERDIAKTPKVPVLVREEHTVAGRRRLGTLQVAAPETVIANKILRATFLSDISYETFVYTYWRPVPKRICAVIPDGVSDFNRVLIFFHPLPTKKAGYEESAYDSQTGGWENIYRYCDQQGAQLAASKRKIILIFPIFNLASTGSCGAFPEKWEDLIQLVLRNIRDQRFPGLREQPMPITDVITASYSAGIKYMHTFLTTAARLKPVLKEVWDFDGRFSSESLLSEHVSGIGASTVLTYDQKPVKITDVEKEFGARRGIHIPEFRWHDQKGRDGKLNSSSFIDVVDTNAEVIKGSKFVHGAMPRYLMYHALTRTSVGK